MVAASETNPSLRSAFARYIGGSFVTAAGGRRYLAPHLASSDITASLRYPPSGSDKCSSS